MAVSFYFYFLIFDLPCETRCKLSNLEINYELFLLLPCAIWCIHFYSFQACTHTHTYTLWLCFIQVTHAQSISNSSLSSPSPLFSLFWLPLFLPVGPALLWSVANMRHMGWVRDMGVPVAPVNISHPVEQAFHNALFKRKKKKTKRRGTEVKMGTKGETVQLWFTEAPGCMCSDGPWLEESPSNGHGSANTAITSPAKNHSCLTDLEHEDCSELVSCFFYAV